MALNKGEVKTSEDLQIYLQEKAKDLDRLYHYTTYESLIYVLKNRSLRLSRTDLLNDRAEQRLGRVDKYFKNYIMSFTREKEYVSMWAMYGKPSGIKLRIDFSREILINSINDNFYLDIEKKKKIPLYSHHNVTGVFSKKDFLISDVVYLDKNTMSLRHNTNPFPNIIAQDSIIDELTGFIKYDVWEFEKEARLRVLMHDLDGQANEYVYAGISENFVKDLHITFNPWISDEMKVEIEKSLNLLAGCKLQYKPSQHDGEIKDL